MRWLKLLSAVGLLLVTAEAKAEYPDKPVKIVVSFSAGGTPDTIARRVAQRLTSDLGQQFIIENRPGAAGNIGAESVVHAAPDGYTLLLLANSHIINPSLYAKVNYDPVKDFVPICLLIRGVSLMVVQASSPAKTVEEFIRLAKSQPGKLNYGSGGSGSPAHLSAEAFRLATGIDYLHVPYKGAPEIVRALLGGEIQVAFPTFETAYGQVQQGTLRALATTGAKRSRLLPKVPTLLEALPNGFDIEGWVGLVAPAGTPPEVGTRLNAALFEAMKDQTFRDALESGGSEVAFAGPAEFGALLPGEVVKWRSLVKRIGAKIE
jgi:tripartite-type tricarboxylate transporter receptor subunit TctC